MAVPKRYFHVSQDINGDPELWSFTSKFGERSIRTWLQILVYLDKSGNEWRVTGDWLGTLSRMVRQSMANVSRQIGWMTANGWLRIREAAADGSPLIFEAPNWSKYNRRQEQKGQDTVPGSGADRDPLLTIPTPSPSLTVPTPKKEEERRKKEKSSVSVVPASRPLTLEKGGASSKTAQTWEAYATAYRERYGAAPVRNAKVNGILSRFVERLGEEEAPQVAAFYLTHNRPFYVSARHATDLLLRDAEGLRTEWVTGTKATTLEARTAEQRDSVNEQVKRVRAMMSQGGA